METNRIEIKDLNTKVHYPISSAYRGFSMLGGRSNKCRYA